MSAEALLKSSVFTALLKLVVKDLPLVRLRTRTALSRLSEENLARCIQSTKSDSMTRQPCIPCYCQARMILPGMHGPDINVLEPYMINCRSMLLTETNGCLFPRSNTAQASAMMAATAGVQTWKCSMASSCSFRALLSQAIQDGT